MWTRKEVKERGIGSVKPNYIITVIVSFILLIVAGSSTAFSGSGGVDVLEEGAKAGHVNVTDGVTYDELVKILDNAARQNEVELTPSMRGYAMVTIIFIVAMVMIVAFVVWAIVDALFLNPIEVGCQNYFIKNLN